MERKHCGNCRFWKKADNEFKGTPVGQCSKGYYNMMLPLDRNEPYYLERLVTLDDGDVSCGEHKIKRRSC